MSLGPAVGVREGGEVGASVGLDVGSAVGTAVRVQVWPTCRSSTLQPALHVYPASQAHVQPVTSAVARKHTPPTESTDCKRTCFSRDSRSTSLGLVLGRWVSRMDQLVGTRIIKPSTATVLLATEPLG